MKNLFKKTMLFAAAAMAFVSCENDTTDVNTLPGIDVTVNATVEGTKSHFGDYNATDKTYPTLWDGTEEWYVAINGGYAKANIDEGELTYNDDKTGATVNMEINNVGATGPYTLYALSPATAFTSYAADNYYRLKIGNSQNPSTTSCDPAAQILIAQSEPQEDATSFNVTFKHATAYAKFSFVNLNLDGATVTNVSVESEVPFAGTFDYKFADKGLVAATASNTITLNTTATENLWFACAPVDLQGKKLTFTINTDKGPLTKEVTMPTGKGEFKPGVVATFNINMEGIEFEESVKWELVTNASELAVGDEIIIASSSAAKALSTTQNNNNRAATDVTKQDTYIVDPSNEVQIITLEAGTKANTFAFKVGEKYLYAGSSSANRLYSGTTINDNASWAISITSSGVATVTAQGSNTRNIMQYNGANASSLIFNCYGNTTTTGCTLLSIYKLPSTKPAIVASNIEVSAEGGDGEATYEIKNFTNDDVTGESNAEWLTAVVGSGEILWEAEPNYTGAVRSGEIVLTSASAGVSKTITVSQAADVFEVSAAEISLGADTDATATFTVTSTHAFTLTSPDYDKVGLSVESGKGEVEVTVTILVPNSSGSEVSRGNIVVTRTGDNATKNVAVKQKAAGNTGGDEGGEATPETKTISFTGGSGTNQDTISFTSVSPLSCVITKNGNQTSPRLDSNMLRIYASGGKSNKMTITTTSSPKKNITKVVVTATSGSYATALGDGSATVDSGASVSIATSGSTVTYTITGNTETIEILTSGQARLSKVDVTYQ